MRIKTSCNIKFIMFFISIFFVSKVIAVQEIDVNDAGLIFNGHDPVAYHLLGKALEGKKQFEADYMNGKLRFISKENKELFLANQSNYLPAYAGHCTYGVRMGKKFNGDPNVWAIENDKLYFFLNDGTKAAWLNEKEKNIEISNRLWGKVKYKPLSIPFP